MPNVKPKMMTARHCSFDQDSGPGGIVSPRRARQRAANHTAPPTTIEAIARRLTLTARAPNSGKSVTANAAPNCSDEQDIKTNMMPRAGRWCAVCCMALLGVPRKSAVLVRVLEWAGAGYELKQCTPGHEILSYVLPGGARKKRHALQSNIQLGSLRLPRGPSPRGRP